jgi:hypothetical protein
MTNRDRSSFDPSELTRLRKSIDRAFTAGRLSAEEHERQLAKIEQRLGEQKVQRVDGSPLRTRLFVAIVSVCYILVIVSPVFFVLAPWRLFLPEKSWEEKVVFAGSIRKDLAQLASRSGEPNPAGNLQDKRLVLIGVHAEFSLDLLQSAINAHAPPPPSCRSRMLS